MAIDYNWIQRMLRCGCWLLLLARAGRPGPVQSASSPAPLPPAARAGTPTEPAVPGYIGLPNAYAARNAFLVLPEPKAVVYKPMPRDPFIAADAPTTIVTNGTLPNPAGQRSPAEDAEVFAEAAASQLPGELRIHGISWAPPRSYALVNRQVVSANDLVPLPMTGEIKSNLMSSLRTLGTRFDLDPESGFILGPVLEVQRGGVLIAVPGRRDPVRLEYAKSLDTRLPRGVQMVQGPPEPKKTSELKINLASPTQK